MQTIEVVEPVCYLVFLVALGLLAIDIKDIYQQWKQDQR